MGLFGSLSALVVFWTVLPFTAWGAVALVVLTLVAVYCGEVAADRLTARLS